MRKHCRVGLEERFTIIEALVRGVVEEMEQRSVLVGERQRPRKRDGERARQLLARQRRRERGGVWTRGGVARSAQTQLSSTSLD